MEFRINDGYNKLNLIVIDLAMHITLRQLEVFEAVARHLSFTRAAAELHLTQPAVSMQIKQLEGSVGLPLFEPLGKKIALTEAGRDVYEYSRGITQQLSELEGMVNRLKGLSGGRLKISVASTANYFIPNLLGTFTQRYPKVTVSLDVTNRETLLKQLMDNSVELVIMGQPPDELALDAVRFKTNPLVVVAPPNHSLAHERGIPLERLQDEVFLVREPGSGTRMAMERFFAERHIRIQTGMEVGSNEAIKQSVQAGLGLGLLSRDTLELELRLKRLVILDIAEFPILRHWFVVQRKGKRLSPVAEAFKTFVVSEAEGLTDTAVR
jgi:DNA-binding transcriptional LysR family regulator